MPNRIIKESICTSENIDSLSAFEETCFYRLMVNADDFGRFDARPKILASRLFPLKDITPDQMTAALQALVNADLVDVYEVDGKPYLHLNSWEKHQQTRATKSKYPAPIVSEPETSDSNCNQLISDDSKCPRIRIRNRNTLNDNRYSFIGDEDAAGIQDEHNQVLDAAKNAGFKGSPAETAGLLNLYAVNGLERMLNGISECMKHSAPNLAYLEAVLKGTGRKKSDAKDVHGYGQRDYSGEQQKALERMMNDTWGDETEGVAEKA